MPCNGCKCNCGGLIVRHDEKAKVKLLSMRWSDLSEYWSLRPVVDPNNLTCLVCGEKPSVFRGGKPKKKKEGDFVDSLIKAITGSGNRDMKISIACPDTSSAMSLLKVVKRKLKLRGYTK